VDARGVLVGIVCFHSLGEFSDFCTDLGSLRGWEGKR